MKNFFKKLFFFLNIFSFFLIVLFYFNGGSLNSFENQLLNEKTELVKNFNDSGKINLILGSSITMDAIIPDSIGEDWFSFANGGQNIYESFIFLKYIKDSISVDTILIGLNPFDFVYSYTIVSDNNKLPQNNGGFYIFDTDSVIFNKKSLKQSAQLIKDKYFFKIDKSLIKELPFLKPNLIDPSTPKVISRQGYSGRYKMTGIDIDSHYLATGKKVHKTNYFRNVEHPPNFKYFNIFNDLVSRLDLTTFYMIMPMSNKFYEGIEYYGHKKVWISIIKELKKMEINFIDLQSFGHSFSKDNLFYDEAHLSYEGAKELSEIIKNHLRNRKN